MTVKRATGVMGTRNDNKKNNTATTKFEEAVEKYAASNRTLYAERFRGRTSHWSRRASVPWQSAPRNCVVKSADVMY